MQGVDAGDDQARRGAGQVLDVPGDGPPDEQLGAVGAPHRDGDLGTDGTHDAGRDDDRGRCGAQGAVGVPGAAGPDQDGTDQADEHEQQADAGDQDPHQPARTLQQVAQVGQQIPAEPRALTCHDEPA